MAQQGDLLATTGALPAESLVFAPKATEAEQVKVGELRELVKGVAAYNDLEEIKRFCSDQTLYRYLRARQGDVAKASELLKNSIEWLLEKKPWAIDLEDVEVECRTGKFYCQGVTDRYGRPIIVFDNTVQNTKDVKKQIDALVFVLYRGIYLMKNNVEKYVVVMNLVNFTLTNQPPWNAVKETLATLQDQFPGRLGTVVLYQTPWLFQTVYNLVKPLLNPITASKVVFCVGDVSPGSENDKTMQNIIGPNWKELINADAVPLYEGSSNGYDHAKYWPRVSEDFIAMKKAEGAPLSPDKEKAFKELSDLVAKGPEHWPPREVELIPHSVVINKNEAEPAKKGWFW